MLASLAPHCNVCEAGKHDDEVVAFNMLDSPYWWIMKTWKGLQAC